MKNANLDSDLAARLASSAAQAVIKTHRLTGSIPTRARSNTFRVRFDDGQSARYRLTLERVQEART